MPPLPGESQGIYWPFTARRLPQNRLAWPEMVRVRVEHDVSLVPSLDKRWSTVRYVVRKNSAQTYIDGRLLRETKGIGIEPEGHIRLWVFDGSQLTSIQIRRLPPEDPLFETIALDHHLNASRGIGFQPVTAPQKPAAERTQAGSLCHVGGVPLVIPAPDDRGNDHIDVGRSWMRFGLLEGQDECAAEGPVVITRNGKPAAVLLVRDDDDDLRLLLGRSPRFGATLHAL
jgi:hypothetical protein